MKTNDQFVAGMLILAGITAVPMEAQAADKKKAAPMALSDMVVTGVSDSEDGRPEKPSKTDFSTPKTTVTKKDIEKTNAVTTADSVKYESGVFARQRYIGDPNAPIGMRGSNPYQAGRVMVFMDGMPIWNPLQSSYNGSPRWGLIGPGEIKSVDVLGGPFSAQYSGNAMGGVINYNTLMPQKREIYTEATYMLQPYNSMGTNTNLQGFKTFGSYGDKFGDFSTYFSYNHLENEGQPMTPTVVTGLTPKTTNPTTGALSETNPKGNGTGGAAGTPMLQVGSDGIYHSVDDLYKWKGAYDINPELNTSFVAAFENLDVTHVGQSFLTNTAGQTVWGSQTPNYSANGSSLGTKPLTTFGASQQNRQTFTAGWGLNGRVFGNWFNNTNLSYFDILNDTTLYSNYNPSDPIYNQTGGQAGLRTHWTGSGWASMKSQFNNDEFFGNKNLSYSTGFEYQRAHMMQTQNVLSSYPGNVINTATPLATQSGGTTNSYAWFNQVSWRFLKDWDATPGVRLERWGMEDGTYLTSTVPTGSGLTPAQTLSGVLNPQDRQVSNWAPKFSLGYQPGNWKFRYSVAKAYRYPVADELFGNSGNVNGSQTVANSTLKPEDGTHHNLLGEYDFENGYVRLNLFHENIRNAIYTQYIYLNGSPTLSSVMSSIGEVETNGIDLSSNFDRVFQSNVDFKLNTTILDSKIVANPLNTAVVGNQMPLMPNYRANFLTTYHYGRDLDLSVGTRYQSAMHSQTDNKDTQAVYYGAFNQSVYVDLKSTYHFNDKKGHVSAGIDNINGYTAFYNHPLPLRTFFAQVGYKF